MENQPSDFIQPTQLEPSQAELGTAHRDRSTGLTVFGIVQIILGLMALLFIPLMILTAVLARHSPGGGMPLRNLLSSVLTYTALAALCITLGVGSIRAKRWAWALTLVLSWTWLVTGALMTITMTAVLPTSFLAGMRVARSRMSNAPPMPTGVMAVMLTFIIAIATVFLVVLPIIFVVFYRRKDVEETVKRRDPIPRWTDRCPLPVLAAALLFASGAGFLFVTSFTTPLFPFFGRYLVGIRAAAILIPLAVLDATLAYLIYRLRVGAWWVATIVIVIRLISAALTFGRADLLQAYARMGWSSAQLEVLSANPAMRSHVFLWWGLAFSLLFLGYLIWIKRYFVGPVSPAIGAEPSLPAPTV